MVEFRFENDLDRAIPANDHTPTALGDTRFRGLLGKARWNALPQAVRQRFSQRVGQGESKLYKGYVPVSYTHLTLPTNREV